MNMKTFKTRQKAQAFGKNVVKVFGRNYRIVEVRTSSNRYFEVHY